MVWGRRARDKLFEGLNNYQVDSIVRSSIWRAVRGEWCEAVKNKSKLEWWRRELAKNRDRLGEGRALRDCIHRG